MKSNKELILIFLSIGLLLGSCVSPKKLTYLQYKAKADLTPQSSGDITSSVTPSTYQIMPFDNLFIRVVTPDPQWSALFNVNTGIGGLTQESAALSGYPVDANGNIDIPYVGTIEVEGKTLSEIKEVLAEVFKNYVSDAAITVRLVNNYISVIGEVNAPGRYLLNKDRLNVYEALSLAGDMSIYGNRMKVQLIRPSPYGPVIKEISLTDRSILSSDYFYVMPNDILYVEPIRGRGFQLNSSVFGLFLSTISTALVIISYFRTL